MPFEDLIKEITESNLEGDDINPSILPYTNEQASEAMHKMAEEPTDPMVRAIWLIEMFCELAEHFYKPYGCASGLITQAKEFINENK